MQKQAFNKKLLHASVMNLERCVLPKHEVSVIMSPETMLPLFSGQEGATIDCDEGVPITPFNLEEEMQEGHFDSEGNYFIKKEQQIRDNWLDNIDWVIAF